MAKKTATGKNKKAAQPKRNTADYPIFCIYLYYFKDNKLDLQFEVVDRNTPAYDTTHSEQDVQLKIADVIKGAVIDQTIPHYCDAHDSMHMRRKSIAVFAVESGSLTQNGPIMYTSYQGNDGSHTFFYPKYFNVRLGGRMFYVAYCLNLMKSTTHQDLEDLQFERFRIELPYQKRGWGRGEPGTGGTNMGPPIGPPDRKKKKR